MIKCWEITFYSTVFLGLCGIGNINLKNCKIYCKIFNIQYL